MDAVVYGVGYYALGLGALANACSVDGRYYASGLDALPNGCCGKWTFLLLLCAWLLWQTHALVNGRYYGLGMHALANDLSGANGGA